MPQRMTVDENKRVDQDEKALTCIRPAYTLCGTPEPESNETEELIVKNFLNVLAEISIAVASRKEPAK